MKALRKCFLVIFVLMLAAAGATRAPAATGEAGEGTLVGRIAHVEGQLLRYVPEEKDWVATVRDAPFGLEDSLYSDAAGKAEFIMPNNTWIRIGGSTQIQLITLRTDLTEADVAAGMARFYNRDSQGIIRATSPFGYVVAPANSVFDLYVGDRSLEVIALKGKVDLVLDGDQSRYEVTAGGASMVSDGQQVTSGQGYVDADWDDWNSQRDQLWTKRTEVRGESVRYLPPSLHDESYALDENGRWEQVYYEGRYRPFWRPTVAAGWAPFTAGRWSAYYGDQCWIPYEPFGYVTHHYGNWVYAGNFWYWAPPVVSVQVGIGPFLGLGFGWYPGRVGWIHSGVNIGWIPLAPFEPYYCHRRWGPRTVVVNNVNITNININRYRYANRAVIVKQNHFYGVDNYQNVRITNINRNNIIKNYHAAPVVNNKVIHNYDTMRDRHRFTNARVEYKPHDSVLNRISHNQQMARRTAGGNARAIQQEVAAFQPGRPLNEARIEAPRVTDRLVRPSDAGRATSDLQLPQRELRARSKPPSPIVAAPGRESEARTDRLGSERQPSAPDRGRPAMDEQQPRRPPTGGEGPTVSREQRSPTGGEEGQRVRPAKPGGEERTVKEVPTGRSTRETPRFRPTPPGQKQRTTEAGQPRVLDEPGAGTPRAGGEGTSTEPGKVPSPLDRSRTMRRPGPQPDQPSPGAGEVGPRGRATGQDRRYPDSRPERTLSPDQGEPTTGTTPGSRQRGPTLQGGGEPQGSQPGGRAIQVPRNETQRVRPPQSGRELQSQQPGGRAIQAPSSGNQRTVPSGTGGEVRRPAARTVSPPVEASGRAVGPQAPAPTQRSVAPPQRAAPQQPRAPRQNQTVIQPAEPPPAGSTPAPQAPQLDSRARGGGGGQWQRDGGAQGQPRGRGRGAPGE